VLVSEGEFVGSGDLRQMSEYPISHGEQYHSCILKTWRPAFLHLKERYRSATGLMSEMLSRLLPLPPIKVLTKPVHLRKPANPWPMRKTT
jgi:hypothetical protein